jgi:hypothetical protein
MEVGPCASSVDGDAPNTLRARVTGDAEDMHDVEFEALPIKRRSGSFFLRFEMRETILVPIDGSEESFKGLRYACGLAKRLDASLRVLHVVAMPYLTETVFINLEPFIAAGKDI